MEASSQVVSGIVTENYHLWMVPSILAIVGGIIYYFTQKNVEAELTTNSSPKKIMFRALLASIFIFACCLSTAYFCSKSIELLRESLPFATGANPPF